MSPSLKRALTIYVIVTSIIAHIFFAVVIVELVRHPMASPFGRSVKPTTSQHPHPAPAKPVDPKPAEVKPATPATGATAAEVQAPK